MDYQYYESYECDDYSNDENRAYLRKVPGEKKLKFLISKYLQMAIVLQYR